VWCGGAAVYGIVLYGVVADCNAMIGMACIVHVLYVLYDVLLYGIVYCVYVCVCGVLHCSVYNI